MQRAVFGGGKRLERGVGFILLPMSGPAPAASLALPKIS